MSFRDYILKIHNAADPSKAMESLALESRDCAVKNQSRLNSYTKIFDEADVLSQAKHAAEIYSSGQATSLTGIPVAIKDNILFKGQESSAASKILKNHKAIYDSTVVSKLRAEGAIVVGATNMDEFAMGSSSETSAYGPVKNPKDESKVPGGSSGGSAATVGAGDVQIALGTDTGGSVRQPAAYCGVVGYKPSYGRVSRYGVVAFASSLDQVGVCASDVIGASAAVACIEGKDKHDATTETMPPIELDKIIQSTSGLSDFKFGFLDQVSSITLDSNVQKAWSDLSSKISADSVSVPAWDYALETYYLICSSEASSNLARYDGIRYGESVSNAGADLVSATRGTCFGQEVKQRIVLGTLALSTGYFDAYFKKAAQVRRLIHDQIQKAFEKVDFILMPTAPTVAFDLAAKSTGTLEMYQNDVLTVGVNLAGACAISIPLRSSGLPVGLQVIAKRGADQELLTCAKVLEENFS